MKKSLLFLLSSAMMLSSTSCITEEPDFSTEVVKVENSTISYYSGDDHWYCREALIYVESQPRHVMFPEQYDGEIVSGTRVDWHCHSVTAYYKDGIKVTVDWSNTRM